MENVRPKIQVLDVQTEQVLFECPIEDSERAYEFAAEMEEMGLDVRVVSPTLTETLASSLGLSREKKATYQESVSHELEDHDGSCCFKDSDEKKSIH